MPPTWTEISVVRNPNYQILGLTKGCLNFEKTICTQRPFCNEAPYILASDHIFPFSEFLFSYLYSVFFRKQ